MDVYHLHTITKIYINKKPANSLKKRKILHKYQSKVFLNDHAVAHEICEKRDCINPIFVSVHSRWAGIKII
jgi:hypothetical protein